MTAKMSPSAVLVIQNGATKLVNIKNQDTVTKILDMVPDVVDKITGRFGDVKMDDDIDEAIGDVSKEDWLYFAIISILAFVPGIFIWDYRLYI